MGDPNVDSDHFIQKVIILIIHRKNLYNTKKLNKANLRNPIKHSEYRAQLHNRLKNITEQK
jgi:phosphoribosylformylglycinamidine (FGAM) synthase-like amidotransferase family enzyme